MVSLFLVEVGQDYPGFQVVCILVQVLFKFGYGLIRFAVAHQCHRQIILDIGVHYAGLFGPLPCHGRFLPVFGVAGKLGDFDQDLGPEGLRDVTFVLFEKPRNLFARFLLFEIGEKFPESLLLFGKFDKVEVDLERLVGFVHGLVDDNKFFGDVPGFTRIVYFSIEFFGIPIAFESK